MTRPLHYTHLYNCLHTTPLGSHSPSESRAVRVVLIQVPVRTGVQYCAGHVVAGGWSGGVELASCDVRYLYFRQATSLMFCLVAFWPWPHRSNSSGWRVHLLTLANPPTNSLCMIIASPPPRVFIPHRAPWVLDLVGKGEALGWPSF